MPVFMICLAGALLALLPGVANGGKLQPGFDKDEFIELLCLNARHSGNNYCKNIPMPKRFRQVYRSPLLGLDNRWDLWLCPDSVAVISIRGTVQNTPSLLENFYAAMVPASGQLRLSHERVFDYALSSDPKAAIHTGWLIGMASLADDIIPRLDSLVRHSGISNVLIMGHSQGGAIAYLLTSHLQSLMLTGALPPVQLKTYCSAAPKPGNLYYAYSFEASTQGGWAYNVVNPADWVPETPVAVQTSRDFNTTNPFTDTRALLKQQPVPVRLAMTHVYKRLDKPARKTQRRYQRYLGKFASAFVRRHIDGYRSSGYFPSNNYVRTGATVVLPTNPDYFAKYPNDNSWLFAHHTHEAYLVLAEQLP